MRAVTLSALLCRAKDLKFDFISRATDVVNSFYFFIILFFSPSLPFLMTSKYISVIIIFLFI